MGLAYLPDGTMIDYKEYIQKHPRWQKVRETRFKFDDRRCAICHKDLSNSTYQTHHLSYLRLGQERIRDVITLCGACHNEFHENWSKNEFWKGKESGHWEVFDLQSTAMICSENWRKDRLICRDTSAPNLFNNDVLRGVIDQFFRENQFKKRPIIDPHDIALFVRNKRYELYFDAEERGLTVEQFLDEYYGKKVRGKNPLRVEAGRRNGPFDHEPKSFHRHYSENANIIILMQKVDEIERTE